MQKVRAVRVSCLRGAFYPAQIGMPCQSRKSAPRAPPRWQDRAETVDFPISGNLSDALMR
jgi:hypothetical protein